MTSANDPTRLDDLDPAVAAVLTLLWHAAEEGEPQRNSLARVSKAAGLAMSTLRRTLAMLEDAQVVQLVTDGRERTVAVLTDGGRAFCAALFADAPPPSAFQPAIDATSRPTSFNADSVADDQG